MSLNAIHIFKHKRQANDVHLPSTTAASKSRLTGTIRNPNTTTRMRKITDYLFKTLALFASFLITLLTLPVFALAGILQIPLFIVCKALQICHIPAMHIHRSTNTAFITAWRSMPPHTYIKFVTKHKRECMWGIILLNQAGVASILTATSIRAYLNWWRNSHALHSTSNILFNLTLLFVSCAPLSFTLGFVFGALWYMYKRGKYGRYEVTMRRQGRRGYWLDPSDMEEVVKIAEVPRNHTAPETQASTGMMGGSRDVRTGPGQRAKSHRKSIFGVFGRGSNLKREDIDMGSWQRKVVRSPERAVSRSDSIKTYENDEGTRNAMESIWLGGVRDRFRTGYTGRKVRRETWFAEMENEMKD